MNSTNLLIATMQHYQDMAAKETNPVIKAAYERSVEAFAKRIDARMGNHTLTPQRVSGAIAFMERLAQTGRLT